MGDAGAPSVELTQEPEVAMELVVEKLKLLHYERDFLTTRRPAWPALTRTYFARPAGTAGEQFHYFTSLAAHLLRLAGSGFTAPAQFDDPNAACAAIFAELSQCGFAVPSFAAGKLKHGHGKEVVGVLSGLCDLVVASQYARWGLVEYGTETTNSAGDVPVPTEVEEDDESDEQMNRTYASEDGIGDGVATDEESDDDEEGVYGARSGGPPTPVALRADKQTAEEIEDATAIVSQVDPGEWRLELERVAPQLKVLSVSSETKDWRSHLEQAKRHAKRINETFPDVRRDLDVVTEGVTVQLQKIDQREAFVNAELEPLTQTYRVEKENLAATQRLYDQSAETVADLTNELARVGEKLEEVKHQAQAGAEQIADASPLQKLKTSVGALRSEIGVMEIRIGVVSNALLAMDAKRRDVVV